MRGSERATRPRAPAVPVATRSAAGFAATGFATAGTAASLAATGFASAGTAAGLAATGFASASRAGFTSRGFGSSAWSGPVGRLVAHDLELTLEGGVLGRAGFSNAHKDAEGCAGSGRGA